ncbi:hypothetical protein ABPG74_016047 [Tetrahymena malaccensis]
MVAKLLKYLFMPTLYSSIICFFSILNKQISWIDGYSQFKQTKENLKNHIEQNEVFQQLNCSFQLIKNTSFDKYVCLINLNIESHSNQIKRFVQNFRNSIHNNRNLKLEIINREI